MSVRACGAGVVIILSCVGEREGRVQARQRVGQQDIVTFSILNFICPHDSWSGRSFFSFSFLVRSPLLCVNEP